LQRTAPFPRHPHQRTNHATDLETRATASTTRDQNPRYRRQTYLLKTLIRQESSLKRTIRPRNDLTEQPKSTGVLGWRRLPAGERRPDEVVVGEPVVEDGDERFPLRVALIHRRPRPASLLHLRRRRPLRKLSRSLPLLWGACWSLDTALHTLPPSRARGTASTEQRGVADPMLDRGE
jgi:hypothetical protein